MAHLLWQNMLLHEGDDVTVNDVQPMRERSVTGVITYLGQGYGTIDQDIHFTLSACRRGHRPSCGDRVRAECVEYRHHRNNWRAYRIEPDVEPDEDNKPSSITAKTHSLSIPRPIVPLLSTNGRVSVGHATASTQSDCTMLSVVGLDPSPPAKRGVAVGKGTYQEKLSACRLPGQRPLRGGNLKLAKKLDLYPVPEELRECVEEEGDIMAVQPTLEEVSEGTQLGGDTVTCMHTHTHTHTYAHTQPLCMDNYAARFSSLLFLEEIQREVDIRLFDMAKVRPHPGHVTAV